MKVKDKSEIIQRIERLNKHGYTTIHLFGGLYLVRNWSKRGPDWYCKLPIYLPMYFRSLEIVSDNVPSSPTGDFR
jgi:2-iminoacetate synthase ThiH